MKNIIQRAPRGTKKGSKVAQRRRKGPQGAARTALKLGSFLLVSLTRLRRPKYAQLYQKGAQKDAAGSLFD